MVFREVSTYSLLVYNKTASSLLLKPSCICFTSAVFCIFVSPHFMLWRHQIYILLTRFREGAHPLLLSSLPTFHTSRARGLDLRPDLAPHVRLVRHSRAHEPFAEARVWPFEAQQPRAVPSPFGVLTRPQVMRGRAAEGRGGPYGRRPF